MTRAHTVIVGAGLSGLYTALLIDEKHSVHIIVKDALKESNSQLAQGGIAAEMRAEKDVLQAHMDDTLTAGSHLNDEQAVRMLVNDAHINIDQLLAFNVSFDKDAAGNFLKTKEGGHSTHRVLHSGGDATGKDMMNALKAHIKKRQNITITEHAMATDLLMNDGGACGVVTLDRHGNTAYIIAENVILATGGMGAVYSKTTNANVATGDGIAMCINNDITVEKMAFIQFHPTALHQRGKPMRPAFLISEALRGEGARLLNSEGEAFMEKYHPQKELAPRDTVSQAIYREMYDTWTDHVYLDTRHMNEKHLKQRFPTIYKHLEYHGYTLGIDLIPVSPVQHFNIGGIKTDLDGQTSLNHLYAVGENASTGVHGANRLASNSLLECVVFGRRIAEHINTKNARDVKYEPKQEKIPTYNYKYDPVRIKLGMLMDEHVGIIRNEAGLKTALKTLKEMHATLKNYPNNAIRYYETLNMVSVAINIVEDALTRKESIGCHFRLN